MNNIKLSPICLFVYNRPEHTKKTVEALKKNQPSTNSELFIFSDGPKDKDWAQEVEKVRNYIKTIDGFRSVNIFERKENLGLAKSIISGVTEIVNKFGKVIVLEDDLVTSPYFLKYMNEALDLYQEDEDIASIHGYLYPVKGKLPETFFLKHTSSWGWATWKRGWDLFEKDGKKLMREIKDKKLENEINLNGAYNFSGMLQRQIDGLTDSWAIRWNASSILKNKLNLYPSISLIQNIGQDGTGVHRGKSSRHDTTLSEKIVIVEKIDIKKNELASKALENFFTSLKPTKIKKIIEKVKKMIPKTVKIWIFNLKPNTKKLLKILISKVKGVSIIYPNPKLPNYYLFKNYFNKNTVLVDVGCGFDADFSIYMINKLGLKSIGIDPTLKHKDSLSNLVSKMKGNFLHIPIAISSKKGEVSFNESIKNVSGSILSEHKNISGNEIIRYDIESVKLIDLPYRLNLPFIEYIKLDIEGAEYSLIDDLAKKDLEKYNQIFIEFHHHATNYSKKDTLKCVEKIESFGFKKFTIDDHNFLFYRK